MKTRITTMARLGTYAVQYDVTYTMYKSAYNLGTTGSNITVHASMTPQYKECS